MTPAVLEAVQWIATGTAILAAVMVAANLGSRITGAGFVVFSVSSVAWIAAGVLDGTSSLVVANAALLVVNLVGIYRWLWLSREERDHIVEARRPAPPGSVVTPGES